MSIFEKARTRDTRRYMIDTILPVEVSISSAPTGVTRQSIDRHAEHVVELTLRQNFWANSAQLSGFREQAIKCLAAELYQDVLRELPRLRMAIMSGDKGAALEVAFRIEKATQP